jgi:hypothetical protein
LGTFAAVVVSLRLAREQGAVKLRVIAGLWTIVEGRKYDKEAFVTPDFVVVRAANLGSSPVTITSVEWQIGIFRKRYYFQSLNALMIGANVPPVELTTGREANFYVSINTGWLQGMGSKLNQNFPVLSAWSMRVFIHTTAGQTIAQRLNPDLKRKLVEARKQIILHEREAP